MTWGVWDICPDNICPYDIILAQELYGPKWTQIIFWPRSNSNNNKNRNNNNQLGIFKMG